MITLTDRLAALYEERATLNESMEGVGRDVAGEISPGISPNKLILTAMQGSGKLEKLKQEREWVEKQILAILGNPALTELS